MGTRLIDSVPPAMTTDEKPHITRSAAKAIACSPDEQKRLTVTADALTGIPALRLAIRATFNPCSASGIAHPRITSSISAGSTPGTRAIACPIVVAARSSGRVPRSMPFGALPTGVRTADTITASCMALSALPILHEIFDRVSHFARFSVEEMISCVDDDELFGLFTPCVKL